jgi:hypothetical protein
MSAALPNSWRAGQVPYRTRQLQHKFVADKPDVRTWLALYTSLPYFRSADFSIFPLVMSGTNRRKKDPDPG